MAKRSVLDPSSAEEAAEEEEEEDAAMAGEKLYSRSNISSVPNSSAVPDISCEGTSEQSTGDCERHVLRACKLVDACSAYEHRQHATAALSIAAAWCLSLSADLEGAFLLD